MLLDNSPQFETQVILLLADSAHFVLFDVANSREQRTHLRVDFLKLYPCGFRPVEGFAIDGERFERAVGVAPALTFDGQSPLGSRRRGDVGLGNPDEILAG